MIDTDALLKNFRTQLVVFPERFAEDGAESHVEGSNNVDRAALEVFSRIKLLQRLPNGGEIIPYQSRVKSDVYDLIQIQLIGDGFAAMIAEMYHSIKRAVEIEVGKAARSACGVSPAVVATSRANLYGRWRLVMDSKHEFYFTCDLDLNFVKLNA